MCDRDQNADSSSLVSTVHSLSRIGQGDDGKVLYYSPTDLRVGGWIQVYGRNLFICGADEFTKQYYYKAYGMGPEDFPRLNMDDPEVALAKIEPPPHSGFGSEEDSLASFLYLMPKVPKADFKKLIELDGVNLRFLAKFKSTASNAPGATAQYGGGSKVDAGRRFIVTYFLANDTFQLFEKFERNSGFVGGKFLERDRVKNPLTGEWYRSADFFIGSSIIVNKFEFEIIDCDEYTRKFVANNSHIWGPKATAATTGQPSSAAPGGAFSGESTQQIRETGGTNEQEVRQRVEEVQRSRPASSQQRQVVGQHNTGSPRYAQ
jgi:hypothetical protein